MASTTTKKAISIILAVVILSGISVALYLYSEDRHALTYYGDAGSHLVAARKLFDWAENPGWSQIGTVWLPLPHFLFMFPSLIDGLFYSGFAGLAVNLPSTALTSVILYKIMLRISQWIPQKAQTKMSIYSAFSVALLYGLNPNILYLGITAMTEALFMLFFVAAAYCILKWHDEMSENGRLSSLKFLALSSLFIVAATLCRYEGWVLPIFLIPFSLIVTVRAWKRNARGNTSQL
ncbi:MAG TPA: hypothetical protein VJP79_01205, partial [Nitrososphaera sp.]|nr:hypothetical protein [Nitrososphaera sp.]